MNMCFPTTILVVDYDQRRREVLRLVLTHAGYHVLATEDGVHALKTAVTARPDLALIELALPGLDGYAVAQGLRAAAQGRRMHIIAMTGPRYDRQRALSAGFDMHLPKPIQAEALIQVIASLRKLEEPAA